VSPEFPQLLTARLGHPLRGDLSQVPKPLAGRAEDLGCFHPVRDGNRFCGLPRVLDKCVGLGWLAGLRLGLLWSQILARARVCICIRYSSLLFSSLVTLL
jgi:hypothetical protein